MNDLPSSIVVYREETMTRRATGVGDEFLFMRLPHEIFLKDALSMETAGVSALSIFRRGPNSFNLTAWRTILRPVCSEEFDVDMARPYDTYRMLRYPQRYQIVFSKDEPDPYDFPSDDDEETTSMLMSQFVRSYGRVRHVFCDMWKSFAFNMQSGWFPGSRLREILEGYDDIMSSLPLMVKPPAPERRYPKLDEVVEFFGLHAPGHCNLDEPNCTHWQAWVPQNRKRHHRTPSHVVPTQSSDLFWDDDDDIPF